MTGRGLVALAALVFVAACSSPAANGGDAGADASDASDAGGPTWLDASPATLDYDAEQPADAGDPAADALEDAAPVCTRTGSCGGSWERYACPRAYVPPPASHCTLDYAPDSGPTFEWCCYGERAP